MGLPASLVEVESLADAAALASRVLNPQRPVPLVVVSLPGDLHVGSGVLDLDELRGAVGVRADVAIVGDDHVDAFNRGLPRGLAVFGDAVRVYPSASSWSGKLPHCEVVAAGHDLDYGLWRVRQVVDALNPPRPRPAVANDAVRAATPGDGPRGSDAVAASWRPDGAPSSRVLRLSTVEEVDGLSTLLMAGSRRYPVVVVTIPAGQERPWIDVDSVMRELSGLAWVFEVPSGRLTFRLNDAIGSLQGVYGGAGRVYSTDLGWLVDPYLSKLRTVYDQRQGDRVTDELVADALGMAISGGTTDSTVPSGEVVCGTVGILVPPTRAIVRLDDGRPAAVWGDTIPGASGIDRAVQPGQRVEGVLDPVSGRLDLHARLRDVGVLLEQLAVGDVVLSRVKEVASGWLVVAVWPGTDVVVDADHVTGNGLDDLRDLATVGEVLPARVLDLPDTEVAREVSARNSESAWSLSLLDVEPEDGPTAPPPALLPGGPPWLTPATSVREADQEPAAAPSTPGEQTVSSVMAVPGDEVVSACPRPPGDIVAAPTPPPGRLASHGRQASELADLRAEVHALRESVRSQQDEIARLRAAGDRLRTTNRRARVARRTQAEARPVHGFADPQEQLRWNIYRVWVEQTRPEDKPDRPLPDTWHIGSRFMESMALPGISRDKVLSVVVHVLTGNAPRETHPLRTSMAGNAPQVQRADGALAWRTPLQQSSPSARRLHWWRRLDKTIELSRVVLHDDFQP